MANAATLATLRTRVLDMADMTGSSFPVSDRVKDHINEALADIHDTCIQSEKYFRSSQSISLVNGTETYSLPSDYYRTLKMYYTVNSRRYKMEEFNLDEIDGYRTAPLNSGTVEHWYTPQFTPLSGEDDAVDTIIPIGWEGYVVYRAAALLALREESFSLSNQLDMQATKKMAQIKQLAAPRDEGEARAISDHYGRWNSAAHIFPGEDRHFRYKILGDNVHIIELEWLGV